MDCRDTADCITKLKPHTKILHSVDVTDAEGVVTKVGIPKRRFKWKTLAKNLDDLQWRRVQAKDKGGATLGIFALEDDAETEFNDESQLEDDDDMMFRFAEKVVSLVLKAQEIALKAQEKQSKSLMDGHASLARVLTERLTTLERMYASNLRMAQNAVENMGDDDGLLSGTLGQLIPGLLQAQAIKEAAAAAQAGQRAKKPNGAPKRKPRPAPAP